MEQQLAIEIGKKSNMAKRSTLTKSPLALAKLTLKTSCASSKRAKGRKIFIKTIVSIGICIVFFAIAFYSYNNFCISSNEEFSKRVDTAIEKALLWVKVNNYTIIDQPNVAMFRMLQDANSFHREELFEDLVKKFLAMPLRPSCWK